MDLFKHFRLLLTLTLVLFSVYIIFSPLISQKVGVIVTKIDPNVTCNNVKQGDTILYVGGDLIRNSKQFKSIESNTKKDVYVAMKVNTGPGGCVSPKDGYLGVEVADFSSYFLKFSPEIGGGYEFVLKPSSEIDIDKLKNASEIIQKRILLMSFQDAKSKIENNKIVIDSIEQEKLSDIISKGDIEVYILYPLKFEVSNGKTTGNIKIGSNSYQFVFVNGTIDINGTKHGINEPFLIEGIRYTLLNSTQNSAIIEANVFGSKDISKTNAASPSVVFNTQQNLYEFSVPYELPENGQRKLLDVIKNMESISQGESLVLDGLLIYKVNDEEINRLAIPSDFKSQDIRILSIIGFSSSSDSATNKMKYINSVLDSGPLDVDLSLEQTRFVEPKDYRFSLNISLMTIASIVVFIPLVFYKRYKRMKISLHALFVLASEFIILLAIVSYIQRTFGGLVIDMSIVYMFIVTLVLSIAEMIILSEEKIRMKILNMKIGRKNIMKMSSFLIFMTLMIGFLLMFIKYRYFGLLLVIWILISETITKPYLKKHLM